MSTHRSRAFALGAAVVAACLLSMPAVARAQSDVERKVTVGIFNRAYLVQTFYRSAAWKAKLTELVAARNDAAVAGDSVKTDAIDKQLADMQSLAQRQLAGAAPLTNIYDALKGEWAAIAREAKVDIIVEPPLYVVPGSVLTDVTPVMIKHLNTGG
ncbi:MAG TPA: hypothetical protein VMD31_04600 [Opitutaceae bacterium]|nr:hypothetical protein [Opitutaceae bacterium]